MTSAFTAKGSQGKRGDGAITSDVSSQTSPLLASSNLSRGNYVSSEGDDLTLVTNFGLVSLCGTGPDARRHLPLAPPCQSGVNDLEGLAVPPHMGHAA